MTEQAVESKPMTWAEQCDDMIAVADELGEVAGVPVPVPGYRMTLVDDHPLKRVINYAAELMEGDLDAREQDGEEVEEVEPETRTCSSSDVDETFCIVNSWYSRSKHSDVDLYISHGKLCVEVVPRSAIKRLEYWVKTSGASQGWDIRAERTAMDKLRELVKPHIADMYELTGAFLETSKRSGVTYFFRRCRPTIAAVPLDRTDPDTNMKILTALCLHPLGYYDGTWAGAMVPTDDVIAHLLYMRGDERGFWAKANHHHLEDASAGL